MDTVIASAGAILALMLAAWIVSLIISDASIVDIIWGPGFVLAAWAAFLASDGAAPRRWLVVTLVTIWGMRLGVYLGRRNIGSGEDYRYRAMRARHGDRFWLVSLGTVFLLQGALMFVVSTPVRVAVREPDPAALGVLDTLGIVAWVIGAFFEAVGDAQLARFKADPANRGQVMDRGLWRYTRHPNYFGDFMVWWGIGLIALATGVWWALVGPVVMSILLLRVSGVTMLERTITSRRPAYAAYAERTNAFFPWFPDRA